MRGLLRSWVSRRVEKEGLGLARKGCAVYREIQASLHQAAPEAVLSDCVGVLSRDEEDHERTLLRLADGDPRPEHAQTAARVRCDTGPLPAVLRERYGEALRRAIALEEQGFLFYSNLQRLGAGAPVQGAFTALAAMKKGHLEMLRALLAEEGPGG